MKFIGYKVDKSLQKPILFHSSLGLVFSLNFISWLKMFEKKFQIRPSDLITEL